MPRLRGWPRAAVGVGLAMLLVALGALSLQSPRARGAFKSTQLFLHLNSPTIRELDAKLFNLRHDLLTIDELGDGGPVERVRLFDPMGLDRDSAGNLYVTDRGGGPGPGRVVWRLGPDGSARIVAGTGRRGTARTGRPARLSDLGSPQSACVDGEGRVYFADSYNHVVLRIESDGTLTRVAGVGRPGWSGDGGPAERAALNQPYDVRLDPAGGFYIADVGNHRIRRVSPEGIISTVAGTGEPGYSGDGGAARAARLHYPYGIYAAAGTGLLIGDTHNDVVRVVDEAGSISTLAGSGRRGLSGDDGPASRAALDAPQGLYQDDGGAVFVGDEHNHVIRRIDPDGFIRRVAGTGQAGFSPDGTPALAAALNDPENLVVLDDGIILFTEAGNGRVRRVGPDGLLATIAGGVR